MTEPQTERIERPAVYRVLMSDVLFEQLGAEAVDWGEPDHEGFYSPTVHTAPWHTVHDATAPLLARIDRLVIAINGFLWMGNNIHNAGTDTFRDLYTAACDDARKALEP